MGSKTEKVVSDSEQITILNCRVRVPGILSSQWDFSSIVN